jgi:hypothetical protein
LELGGEFRQPVACGNKLVVTAELGAVGTLDLGDLGGELLQALREFTDFRRQASHLVRGSGQHPHETRWGPIVDVEHHVGAQSLLRGDERQAAVS